LLGFVWKSAEIFNSQPRYRIFVFKQDLLKTHLIPREFSIALFSFLVTVLVVVLGRGGFRCFVWESPSVIPVVSTNTVTYGIIQCGQRYQPDQAEGWIDLFRPGGSYAWIGLKIQPSPERESGGSGGLSGM
jgi:hypothetical protein